MSTESVNGGSQSELPINQHKNPRNNAGLTTYQHIDELPAMLQMLVAF